MDRISFAKLINDSGEEIEVHVFYNKSLLDSSNVPSYEGYLKQQGAGGQSYLVSISTNDLTVTYRIPKDGIIDLSSHFNSDPDLQNILKVAIYSGSGKNEYSKDTIVRTMVRKGSDVWEWHVK